MPKGDCQNQETCRGKRGRDTARKGEKRASLSRCRRDLATKVNRHGRRPAGENLREEEEKASSHSGKGNSGLRHRAVSMVKREKARAGAHSEAPDLKEEFRYWKSHL